MDMGRDPGRYRALKSFAPNFEDYSTSPHIYIYTPCFCIPYSYLGYLFTVTTVPDDP